MGSGRGASRGVVTLGSSRAGGCWRCHGCRCATPPHATPRRPCHPARPQGKPKHLRQSRRICLSYKPTYYWETAGHELLLFSPGWVGRRVCPTPTEQGTQRFCSSPIKPRPLIEAVLPVAVRLIITPIFLINGRVREAASAPKAKPPLGWTAAGAKRVKQELNPA